MVRYEADLVGENEQEHGCQQYLEVVVEDVMVEEYSRLVAMVVVEVVEYLGGQTFFETGLTSEEEDFVWVVQSHSLFSNGL